MQQVILGVKDIDRERARHPEDEENSYRENEKHGQYGSLRQKGYEYGDRKQAVEVMLNEEGEEFKARADETGAIDDRIMTQ